MGGDPAALAQGNAQKQQLQNGAKDDPLFSL
jgi:hypothetical protein